MGMEIRITQALIAKVLGLDDRGEILSVYKNYNGNTKHQMSIINDLFHGKAGTRSAKHLSDEHRVAFRIFQHSMLCKETSSDQMTLLDKHLIYFLAKRIKINLANILFEHLVESVDLGNTNVSNFVTHPRLIPLLFFQSKLIKIVKSKEHVSEIRAPRIGPTLLKELKIIKHLQKQHVSSIREPNDIFYDIDGFPFISEEDAEEVITIWLLERSKEVGFLIPRNLVPKTCGDVKIRKRKRKTTVSSSSESEGGTSKSFKTTVSNMKTRQRVYFPGTEDSSSKSSEGESSSEEEKEEAEHTVVELSSNSTSTPEAIENIQMLIDEGNSIYPQNMDFEQYSEMLFDETSIQKKPPTPTHLSQTETIEQPPSPTHHEPENITSEKPPTSTSIINFPSSTNHATDIIQYQRFLTDALAQDLNQPLRAALEEIFGTNLLALHDGTVLFLRSSSLLH